MIIIKKIPVMVDLLLITDRGVRARSLPFHSRNSVTTPSGKSTGRGILVLVNEAKKNFAFFVPHKR